MGGANHRTVRLQVKSESFRSSRWFVSLQASIGCSYLAVEGRMTPGSLVRTAQRQTRGGTIVVRRGDDLAPL